MRLEGVDIIPVRLVHVMMRQHQRVFPRRVGIFQAVAQRELLKIAAQVQDLLELRPTGRGHSKSSLVQPIHKLIGGQKAEGLADRGRPGIERYLESINLQALAWRNAPRDDVIPQRQVGTLSRGLRRGSVFNAKISDIQAPDPEAAADMPSGKVVFSFGTEGK